MTTPQQRATAWLSENQRICFGDAARSLALLLKEQDQITRHACAEAVLQTPNVDFDAADKCHAACINSGV